MAKTILIIFEEGHTMIIPFKYQPVVKEEISVEPIADDTRRQTDDGHPTIRNSSL